MLVGGPFGRDGQLYLTSRNPGFDFWGAEFNFGQIVKARQLIWEESNPWTEGLSRLFDSAQEELNFQHSFLAEEAKRLESAFTKLSAFEKIAHEYLADMRRSTTKSRSLGEGHWLKLFDTLDKGGIAVEDELTDAARRVLEAVRRKGHQITSWTECYQFRGGLRMDDGRTRRLRREVMRAVHNGAKKAAYQLAKVSSVTE